MHPLFMVLLFVTGAYSTLPLPPYIKACSRTDPKLPECLKKQAQDILPQFVKGEKRYGLPNMDPLVIDKIELEKGPMNLTVTNVKMHDLKSAQIKQVVLNVHNGKNSILELFFNKLPVTANYAINAKLSAGFALKGNGPCRADLYNATVRLVASCATEMKKCEILKCISKTFDVKADHETYFFGNLFNGSDMGKEMNRVMNENWQQTHHQIAEPLFSAIGDAIMTIINSFTSFVCYKDLLLP